MNRPPRLVLAAALLLSAVALAQSARAQINVDDDQPDVQGLPPADPVCASVNSGRGGACAVAAADRFCDSVESCKRFCCCACDYDAHKWTGDNPHDGATSCPRAPQTGPGIIAPTDASLQPLPDLGPEIVGTRGKRATQAVIDGLRRLKTYIQNDPSRQRLGYRVKVSNCYRPAVGDAYQGDTEAECGLMYRMMHIETKFPNRKAEAESKTPPRLGLAWPGATPHSAGFACDLVVVDRRGNDCFDWRAGVTGAPTCAIDQRAASRALDAAVTDPSVGGKRLNYEAWHFEWGGPQTARCSTAQECDLHWPPTGTP